MAKRRKRLAAGGIAELRDRLWAAVEAAASIVEGAGESPELRLRAIHAMTQSSSAYVRVLEAAEFESRLRVLEDHVLK